MSIHSHWQGLERQLQIQKVHVLTANIKNEFLKEDHDDFLLCLRNIHVICVILTLFKSFLEGIVIHFLTLDSSFLTPAFFSFDNLLFDFFHLVFVLLSEVSRKVILVSLPLIYLLLCVSESVQLQMDVHHNLVDQDWPENVIHVYQLGPSLLLFGGGFRLGRDRLRTALVFVESFRSELAPGIEEVLEVDGVSNFILHHLLLFL